MKTKSKLPTVLVTLGPTRAYLDRFRYISNHSTGELGYQVCKGLARRGYPVVAVAGPCQQPLEDLKGVQVERVVTVMEMRDAVMKLTHTKKPEFAVLAAAVLDFAPKKTAEKKVSSKQGWNLHLVPTPKIIDELSLKFPKLKKIGFKLEWEYLPPKAAMSFGIKNIKEKKLEALCLNYLSKISMERHPAFLITKEGNLTRAESKIEIADWIISEIESRLN